jgi:hypothetical protein
MRNCRTIYAAHVRPAYSVRMSVPPCYPSTPVTDRLSRPSSFVRLFFDKEKAADCSTKPGEPIWVEGNGAKRKIRRGWIRRKEC